MSIAGQIKANEENSTAFCNAQYYAMDDTSTKMNPFSTFTG